MRNRLLLAIFLLCALSFCHAQQLITYPTTTALPQSPEFTVKVRIPGQPWKDVAVYHVTVADGTQPQFVPRATSLAWFDFSGRVDVAITTRKKFSSVRIRPLSCAIPCIARGNTLTFSLDRPRNLSIEPDGALFDNLQLFAGAPETNLPDKADTNTLYYAPGIHKVGSVHLTSGKKVYLAGGAVVEGQFFIDHQQDVHISGRGILLQPPPGGNNGAGRRDAFRIDYSRHVSIEGIIVIPNTYTVLMGSSRDIRISGIKSFSAGGNNDGIDVFCSENVLIDGVFMRNSDDCIAIYGHRWNYYGNTRHVTVRHSTLWADVAHPILVGTHGDPAQPDTLEDLRFTDLDILDQHENQVDYQGCMALDAGDSNLIRRVTFDDIRVEDFRKGQLLNLRVMYNKKYNTAPGKGIEDVLFKDVTYTGAHAGLSVIAGYDDAHPIRNVTFQHLRINGVLISDNMPGKPVWYKTADLAGFFVGEHVDGLRFVSE
jgi:hypothetical protein